MGILALSRQTIIHSTFPASLISGNVNFPSIVSVLAARLHADGVREYRLTLQGTAYYYHFPTFAPIAATALALILDKPHAIPKTGPSRTS